MDSNPIFKDGVRIPIGFESLLGSNPPGPIGLNNATRVNNQTFTVKQGGGGGH